MSRVMLQYCHYVAGLVGIGLSRLFSVSKLEDASVGANTKLSNSMGLFLQKTNIIRDYLEDVRLGRHFWPRQVTFHVPLILFHSADEMSKFIGCKCLRQ